MEAWREELYHHGIKGMRWGIRRYQNKDGTLTEEGKRKKKVYDEVNQFAESRRKYKQSRSEDVNDVVGAARKGVEAGNEVLRTYDRFAARRKKTLDLSGMTDQELQKRINRMNLEQQYTRLVSADGTSKGRQFTEDVLSVAGSVLAVAGSAASIALTVHQLRK